MTETLNREYFAEGLPLSIVNCQLSTPNHAISFDADTIAAALVNIYQKKYGNGTAPEPTLFEKTKEIFSDAIRRGVAGQRSEKNGAVRNDAFVDALRHNTDVFSAFRTHKMQSDIAAQLLDEKGRLKPFGQFLKDVKPYVSHQNRAWLETEYNTAVLRAHQAADWKQFEAEKDVLPNLEWLPSTSPNPGEDHKPYWFTVLPIDHKFWNNHRPGDRWNCKCNLRNTDKPATAVPTETLVKNLQPSKGLDTNPGTTGEIFSNSHPYYPENCGKCPFNKGVGRLIDLATGRKKHCGNCKNMAEICNENEWKNFEPAPKFVIDENKYKELAEVFDTQVSLNDIKRSSMEKFDAIRLLHVIGEGVHSIGNDELQKAWSQVKRSLTHTIGNQISLKILGRNFKLVLYFGKDKSSVTNKFIRILPPKSGLGSVVSLELLKQYVSMGITTIKADPGLENGGYTWARMGYYARNRAEAEKVVLTRFKGKDVEDAMATIESFYQKSKKKDTEPFPMQKLATKKYFAYLQGANWNAVLNPQNHQRKGMIRYLRRKLRKIEMEKKNANPTP